MGACSEESKQDSEGARNSCLNPHMLLLLLSFECWHLLDSSHKLRIDIIVCNLHTRTLRLCVCACLCVHVCV